MALSNKNELAKNLQKMSGAAEKPKALERGAGYSIIMSECSKRMKERQSK